MVIFRLVVGDKRREKEERESASTPNGPPKSPRARLIRPTTACIALIVSFPTRFSRRSTATARWGRAMAGPRKTKRPAGHPGNRQTRDPRERKIQRDAMRRFGQSNRVQGQETKRRRPGVLSFRAFRGPGSRSLRTKFGDGAINVEEILTSRSAIVVRSREKERCETGLGGSFAGWR